MIAQGAHAATSVLATYPTHANVQTYISPDNRAHMTKVILQCKNLNALQGVAAKLDESGLKYCVWKEMPEAIETALATVPYTRDDIGDALKKCQLYT